MNKDIAIIGGSTSGFFTAGLLAREGADVRVFEASEKIEPDHRTLIVIDYIRKALGKLCDDIVVNKIRRFELYANGRVGSVSLQRPDLLTARN
jgi:2-polyprenyl-6-methoxyphenol hydroxylase-like FAD-dependent oxidoreductase